jgi:hypothetical protein
VAELQPIEDFVPLSQSKAWDIQKRFYAHRGPQAWHTHQVPHYVTGNSIVASSYARTLSAFIEDCIALGPEHPLGQLDLSKPVEVVELGSGGGRLGFLLARELAEISKARELPSFRVILTDFNEANVRGFESRPEFQRLRDAGLVDFAIFDADDPRPLSLRHSGESLEQSPNPILIVANYVIDTLRQDAFATDGSRLMQVLYRTLIPSGEDPEAPNASALIELATQPSPIELPHYQDPFLDGLLTRYRDGLTKAEFLIPVGGIRALQHLLKISGGRGCLMVGDKGYRRLADLDRKGIGAPPKHGSFSFMVNFDALGCLAEAYGGSALTAHAKHTRFTVASFAFTGHSAAVLPRWRDAYRDRVDRFGPAEYHRLFQSLREKKESPDLPSLLLMLRIADHDSVLFARYGADILAAISSADNATRHDLLVSIDEVLERTFPIGPQDDSLFMAGRMLFAMGRAAEARVLFERVTHEQPKRRAGWFNHGVALEALGDTLGAQRSYQRAVDIAPDYARAREALERLQARA